MSSRTDRESLSDIREAARRINEYIAGMDYSDFLQNIKTQDAVIRNLEIIGEAVKNLSDQTRSAFPEVPWKNMAGLRDRLIHHYFGVNLDIVWQIVKHELPDVVSRITPPIADPAIS